MVVDYSAQPPVVTDGPYGETKELFGGFRIFDVASQEEAVEWAKRAPLAGHLAGSHLLPSVRGELLTRSGRLEEARAELVTAIERCGNAHEQTVLAAKVAAIDARTGR